MGSHTEILKHPMSLLICHINVFGVAYVAMATRKCPVFVCLIVHVHYQELMKGGSVLSKRSVFNDCQLVTLHNSPIFYS